MTDKQYPEVIPLNENHQCYTGTEKEARDAFYQRYGRKATRAIYFQRMWWLGPTKESEAEDASV